MFQCLLEYKKKWGDCRVPFPYPDNPKLSTWVQTQRRCFTLQIMDPKRKEQLNSIGFVWRLRDFANRESDAWEEQWEQKYEELLLYKKENGDCNVANYSPENPQLAIWVNHQRSYNAHGLLRADRKKRLDEIGFLFSFEDLFDEAWESKFNQLKQLKGQERSRSRRTWASSDQRDLVDWEVRQHNLMRLGRLDKEREARLRKIGYWKSLRHLNF